MTRVWAFPLLLLSSAGTAAGQGPATPDCAQAQGKVALALCRDGSLAALDRKLTASFAAAVAKIPSVSTTETMEAEQRGFVRQRDACERSREVSACLQAVYTARVSELQAVHGLVPAAGHARFVCEGEGPHAIEATFFESEAPTALLHAGAREVLVFQKPAASGARYEGDGVVFWNKGDQAAVTWEEIELSCRVAK
jgi:uncharacterized protein